jgi:ribonucleoside-diphosphate reductase alpha chain
MNVLKRNNTTEIVSFDKITNRILNISKDLDVNSIIIAKKVIAKIYDNIKTSYLDELIGETCIHLSSENLDYAILSKRIIISNNHKETPNTFFECIDKLHRNNLVTTEVYEFVKNNILILETFIDNLRDYDFDYFGFKTLEKSYLFKIDGKVVERIQYLFMRVSIGLHINNLDNVLKSYEYLSQKYFIHGSPTLFNSGTRNPQLLSCFLLGTEDSINGIYKNVSDCAKISKWSGGIGIHISNIRGKNTIIKGTNGKATGIVPMLRVYNETAKYVNQGGRRNGSIAVYLEPHHVDLLDFLELRKNTGNEDQRTRDLFTALFISDLFMKRVENNEDWSFFNCPSLTEIYGEEYEKKYIELEKQNLAIKTIKAREIWGRIINSQIETGTPYILYKDTINKYNNQSNLGIIKSSNLCAEITEYSNSKEYACCVLASIGLPKFVEKNSFNFNKLGEVVKTIVNNLNSIIDLNYYPVDETRLSNFKHRPLGIGVQGLADVFSILKIDFESEEARDLNIRIFEAIYYYSLLASCELSKENGSYSSFYGSPLSKGIFQFEMRGLKPSNRFDWEKLRLNIVKYGVRNSLLVALMPTASTSQILGYNECFEPYTSNIYSRRTLAGDFMIINKYLVKELSELNLWNKKLKDSIISKNGSIQHLELPIDIKNRYKTVWEINQKSLIQLAIDRSPFICQSQSMNLFFKEPNLANLTSALFFGWKNGLKTGSYYIRSQPPVQAQQFTIEKCEVCSA